MVCINCGKEVKDNATFCEECGAPLEEPVVIKMTKDDIKSAAKKAKGKTDNVQVNEWVGPAINLSGYVTDVRTDITVLLALVGSLLMYLSPFFSWLWRKNGDVKTSSNLFDLSRKTGDLVLDSKLLFLLAVMVLLTGLSMMVMSASKNLKFMQPYLDKKYIFMIPVFVGIIIYILITTGSKYDKAYEIIMNQVQKSSSNAAGIARFSGGRGFGPVLYICGLVSYLMSLLINMFNKK